ncbi:MAG TPA: xanthine dehydrogenase family protein subunit M [Solirubrobacteraceae bacterium]|nr:xanthine dehydrogenase family protein subunit M [Solirubrobacteraceae bacterium]
MRLPPFELHRPQTLEEASRLLSELGPDAQPYCGGTELLLVAKLGLTEFRHLVDLKGIEELSGIETNGELRIGSATTHREIERSAVIRERWPSLAAMERDVANIRVRNVGTIGGNLCFADPHSDPATYLTAAGGWLSARRDGAEARRLAIEAFTRGPYTTVLEPGELLVSVHVPPLTPGSALVHRKLSFHERPAVTVAASITVRDEQIAEVRIAVGSVGLTARRLTGAEEALSQLDAGHPDLRACAEIAAAEAEPLADANGSIEYKRQLVRVMVERTVREALAEARCS